MNFISTNADFSDANIGNSNKANAYIENGEITNTTKQSAIRNLYNSLRSSGLLAKFEVIRLLTNERWLPNSLNLVNPGLEYNSDTSRAQYIADANAAHTLQGFQCDPETQRHLYSNYLVHDLTNFHMHVYNTTSELTNQSSRYMVGAQSNADGNKHFCALGRRYASATSSAISIFPMEGRASAPGSYETTRTGLLSSARNGLSSLKLYGEGEIRAENTSTVSAITVNKTTRIREGALVANDANSTSGAKLAFVAYGATTWSDADEKSLNTMVTDYLDEVGAI